MSMYRYTGSAPRRIAAKHIYALKSGYARKAKNNIIHSYLKYTSSRLNTTTITNNNNKATINITNNISIVIEMLYLYCYLLILNIMFTQKPVTITTFSYNENDYTIIIRIRQPRNFRELQGGRLMILLYNIYKMSR